MKMYICSIFPFPQSSQRRYSPNHQTAGGYTTFVLPEGSMKQPAVLEIDDHWEKIYLGESVGNREATVMAHHILADLMREWNNIIGVDGEGDIGPGIIQIQGPVPTADELTAARARQEQWELVLIGLADRAWEDKRLDRIGSLHRWAANDMGIQDKPWITPLEKKEMTECPLCTKRIPADAIICPQCHHQIKAIPASLQFAEHSAPASKPK